MDHLWTPWRMDYITSHKEGTRPSGCVFCALLRGDADREDAAGDRERILLRGQHAFVTLAKYPYNPGHLLVLPNRHIGELSDLIPEELAETAVHLQRCVDALKAASDPEGFNVGLNLGRVAGAGIPEHLHWHVVPRWSGDTNFMPVVGQTRVLPELLADTYERLAPHFAADEA
jgi:ATP adenylyltransferase